jgi:LysM repeat protein
LLAIAGRYGVSIEAIMDANNITNPDFVFSGQRLVIPRADAASTAAPQASPAATNAGQTRARGCASPHSSATAFSGNEAVQIANDSDLVINLQGWRLEKENGPAYVIWQHLACFPGSGVVLYTGSGVDTSVALYWNQSDAAVGDGQRGAADQSTRAGSVTPDRAMTEQTHRLQRVEPGNGVISR